MAVGGTWLGGMWVAGVLLIAAVTLLVVLVVRATGAGGDRPPGPPPQRLDPGAQARAILDSRYASGEITTDEYRERLHNLTSLD